MGGRRARHWKGSHVPFILLQKGDELKRFCRPEGHATERGIQKMIAKTKGRDEVGEKRREWGARGGVEHRGGRGNGKFLLVTLRT